MTATKWSGHAKNGLWSDATNWSAGVPVAGEKTLFTDGHAWSIVLPAAAQCGTLIVTGDALTLKGGTLTAAAAQPSQGVNADLTIGGGGLVTVAANATLISPDEITLGATIGGTLTPGSLSVFGTLDASLLNIEASTARVVGSHAHVVLSNDLFIQVNDGSLDILHGGALDAGPNTLNVFYSFAEVGGNSQAGTILVAGASSSLTLGIVYLGNGENGVLRVADGGAVHLGTVNAGSNGDGSITVTGAGSVLTTVTGMSIGNVEVQPVGSSITIEHGGSVVNGTYGLDLNYGTLMLDASASLTGTIVSQVGKIEALAVRGEGSTVTLSNDLVLQENFGQSGQYDHNTTVWGERGETLTLAGTISGQSAAVLSAGSGAVVLSNAANSYGDTHIYNAHLEIATTGAAGTGTLTFTGGAAQAPVLQIDAGVALSNVIAGFAGKDAIDLRGFAFGSGVADYYDQGTLLLSNGSASTSLSVSGSYTTGSFAFADDHHGGTEITLRHG